MRANGFLSVKVECFYASAEAAKIYVILSVAIPSFNTLVKELV
jgi:hypothetical protein